MKDTPITSTVDFDKDGVQHGFLKLPHSHDASAWGSIVIPITVAKNGGEDVLATHLRWKEWICYFLYFFFRFFLFKRN